MVPILRPWRWAKVMEVVATGHRAVVVHDLADHAGRGEAGEPRQVDRRLGVAGSARSVPPSRATNGKTWPGVTMSCGPHDGSIATATGARGRPQMPVVTPSRASIETVNAVWWRVPVVRHRLTADFRSARSRVRRRL